MARSEAAREAARQRASAWYYANRDYVKARDRVKYEANPEPRRAYSRAWHAANTEKVRETKARKRAEEPERQAELGRTRNARYRERHLERVRANARAQAAKRFDAPGAMSAQDIIDTHEVSNGVCAYCLAAPATELEHCTPLARGGWNSPENCVVACRRCNRSKGAKTPLEFVFGLRLRPPSPP